MLKAVISMLLVLFQLKLSNSLYVFSPPHAAPVSSSPSSLELETEDSSYTGLPPAYDFSAVLYSLGQMPDMTDIWEC